MAKTAATKKTIKIACKGAGTLSIDLLTPLQGAFKILTLENHDRLKKEILDDGFIEPVAVWEDPSSGTVYVLNGHQRCEVLRNLRDDEGYQIPQIPVSYVEATSLKDAKRKILALASQYGSVSSQGLKGLLEELDLSVDSMGELFNFPEVDVAAILSGLGHDVILGSDVEANFTLNNTNLKELRTLKPTSETISEDEVLPEPEIIETKSFVKTGQKWQLGPHVVMCGDCTAKKDVINLLGEDVVELCFTSPPYADQREYDSNVGTQPKHLARFMTAARDHCRFFAVNLGYSRKDGEVNMYWSDYIEAAAKAKLKFLSWNIWDRLNAYSIGAQTAMFPIEHEWILVFGYEKKSLNRTIPNKYAGETANHGTERLTSGELVQADSSGDRMVHSHRPLGTVHRGDIARFTGKEKHDHPAMFPLHLPKTYIEAMTAESDLVYEPFGGSGTTLLAAHDTGRVCRMMEISPKYCSLAIRRWENHTGETASLLP